MHRPFCVLLHAVLVGVALPGCNPDETPDDSETSASSTTTSGSDGTSSDGTSSGATSSGATSSGGTSSGATSGTSTDPGESTGATTEAADSSTGAAVGGEGICGLRSEAEVTEDAYVGWEEYYLIGDEGLGEPLCVVRFAIERVDDAPAGCSDCVWTHRVRRTFDEVVLDEDGVCARSELGLDEDSLAELDGTEFDVGYVVEYTGHNDVLMGYDAASQEWSARQFAHWDDEGGTLTFDRRDGICAY